MPLPGAGARSVDATGNYYGAPLIFDRPVKAVFSADGGTAYVLNCGPECGGTSASVSLLPVAPMIFLAGQASGTLPTRCTCRDCSRHSAIMHASIPGGASNALVNGSTMYVVGQQPQPDGLFTGNLTVVNLPTAPVRRSAVPIHQRRAPGAMSRMIQARRQHALDRHDQVQQRRALCQRASLTAA